MRSILYVAAAALAAAPMLASAEPSMKFWSREESPGAGEHQVLPYRVDNEMIVVVHDPVVCGQKPAQARFSLEQDRVILKYDLTDAPADARGRSCVAVSIFKIDDLPARPLQVRFAGGPEPFSVAQLKRCPSQAPKTDEWDCQVPGN